MVKTPVYHHVPDANREDPLSHNPMAATTNLGMGSYSAAINHNMFLVWEWPDSLSQGSMSNHWSNVTLSWMQPLSRALPPSKLSHGRRHSMHWVPGTLMGGANFISIPSQSLLSTVSSPLEQLGVKVGSTGNDNEPWDDCAGLDPWDSHITTFLHVTILSRWAREHPGCQYCWLLMTQQNHMRDATIRTCHKQSNMNRHWCTRSLS